MTLDDFKCATESMLARDIYVRAFILLQTPWQNEEEGMYWAKESIDFAQSYRSGVFDNNSTTA